MNKLIILQFFLLMGYVSYEQSLASLPLSNDVLKKQIENISSDKNINVDSTWNILSNWNVYQPISKTKKWYLFLYTDSIFGTVPLKIYIPENYQSSIASPAVLILHGAVVLSSFKDIYKDTPADDDIFYNYFSKQNIIIIRPYADSYGPNADGTVNFDWVVNRFNTKINRNKTNPTFKTLTNIICQLKQVVNIDDNKVFAFGHSDGSDGAFALEVYKPNLFAGFVVYNSMLTTIRSYDTYLRNTLNRSLYLVHSDLDDLRLIQQTLSIMKILDSLKSPVLYKEYIGYKHFDKHLQTDLPYSYEWMKGISRNPFNENITWELSDSTYNMCDWLRVTQFDTTLQGAKWQTVLNTKLYNKRDKIYMDDPYYDLNKSVAVKANYNNNVFSISTSRVKEIELFISPVMVNLQNPVIITVNGKEVFNKKINAEKAFLLNNFNLTFDRKTLWVTSVKVKTK